MSFNQDRSFELWQKFMPLVKSIDNRISDDLFSMQIFPQGVSMETPELVFTKWAAAPVSELQAVPQGMRSYRLKGGLYAVFNHHGPASAFAASMQYIFGQWLPNSNYQRDQREHFERLPKGYVPTDHNAQEEIWIPIKARQI